MELKLDSLIHILPGWFLLGLSLYILYLRIKKDKQTHPSAKTTWNASIIILISFGCILISFNAIMSSIFPLLVRVMTK